MDSVERGSVATLSRLHNEASMALAPAVIEASPLPTNFPQTLDSPLSWVGKNHDDGSSSVFYLTADGVGKKSEDDSSYILQLTEDEKLELEQALKHFKCKFAFLLW